MKHVRICALLLALSVVFVSCSSIPAVTAGSGEGIVMIHMELESNNSMSNFMAVEFQTQNGMSFHVNTQVEYKVFSGMAAGDYKINKVFILGYDNSIIKTIDMEIPFAVGENQVTVFPIKVVSTIREVSQNNFTQSVGLRKTEPVDIKQCKYYFQKKKNSAGWTFPQYEESATSPSAQ